jgi:uncharacterized protein YbaP (TraB family)
MKRVVVLVTLVAALGSTSCQKRRDPATAPSAASETTAPSAASALGGQATVAPAHRAAPLARPLLWSVEKAGAATYFFGTMHVGIDAEARLPPLVWGKLATARAFAMEADLDDAAGAASIQPTATSLRQGLGEAYWAKLETAMGASVARAIEHMPPLVPAAALSMRGLPSTPAMDKVLAERAVRAHKPIIFLESAAHQLALLGKWMDLRALKMMLDELPASEQRVRTMLAAYAEGDERSLLAISDDERAQTLQHGYTAAEYDQQMNDLLYDRNAAWIPALERLHAAGGGFVAVGALHLIGPRSVLELLADKGYQVTRLTP